MGNLTVKESGEMINFISPNVSKITSFKVHFSPRQEGSGDPSPENVREIVGWNGVEGYISNVAQPYSSTSNTLTAMIDWTEDVGTVYGGYVDLISGELVQTIKRVEFAWGDCEGATVLGNTERRYIMFNDNRFKTINNLETKVSNIFSTFLGNSSWDADEVSCAFGNNTIICKLPVGSDNNTIIQVAGDLATPITHQLTPQQLSTLKGQNNFWSNADYVEIEYELTETFDIQKAKRKIILNQPHVESASGDLVTFDTDMKGKLKECKVYFSPVQEGEGDPSPDNVRNITGWDGVSVGLPSEYQEVEYIESTGTQWINTGVIGKPNIEVNAKFELTDNTDTYNCGLIGSRESGNVTRFYIISFYTHKWHLGIPDDKTTTSYPINRNQIQDVIFEYTNGNYSLIVDNTKVFTGQSTIATTYPMYLFGVNNYGTVSRLGSFRLYSLIIHQDGIFVRNFIPCYRKSDNEIGMYDTVSKQFFTNQGTGTFLKGDDVGIQASIDWTNDVGSIYGGYVDLVNGELVEEWHSITFDGENVKVNSDYSNIGDTNYIKAYRVYFSPLGISSFHCKCNTLKITYSHNKSYIPQTPCFFLTSNGSTFGGLILGKKEDYSELAEGTAQDRIDAINNWFKENPTQVIYKLRTPIHYQLTPQQLTALRGTNTIYSSTNGQTEIKYWKH